MILIFRKTKYIVLLLVVVGVISGAFLFNKNGAASPSSDIGSDGHVQSSSTTSTEPPLTFGQITKEERINHVNWAFSNENTYQSFNLANEKYVITFYQWRSREQSPKRAGLLVFRIKDQQPELYWESEPIPGYTRPLISVMDVTGDENNDILALWQNGQYESLYIYEKNGNSFKLLSPFGSGSILPVFNAADSEIILSDLDGDQVPEVWFPTELTDEGKLTELHYVSYKWNGSEYFVWKKQQEPFGVSKSFLEQP